MLVESFVPRGGRGGGSARHCADFVLLFLFVWLTSAFCIPAHECSPESNNVP